MTPTRNKPQHHHLRPPPPSHILDKSQKAIKGQQAFAMRVAMGQISPPKAGAPSMDKASDVFFLDADMLRKMRPGQKKMFNHGFTEKDLVKQVS